MVLEIIGGVCLLLIVLTWPIGVYNGLTERNNMVENSFSSIDVILKKRYDLIPDLVAVLEQHMKHETALIRSVTELRSSALGGNLNTDQKVELNNQLSQAIRSIRVSVENYPTVKASGSFHHLERSLNEVEEQLSAARRAYNASVMDMNNSLDRFPTVLLSRILGFSRREMFQASEAERRHVPVGSMFSS